MQALVTSVLSYALWPLLTFAMAALWLAAMLDIMRYLLRGTFTSTRLLGMATLVSVVAVIAIAGISGVFAGQWFEAVARASSNGIQTSKQRGENPTRAYLFSFGLEHATKITPAKSMSEKQQGQRS